MQIVADENIPMLTELFSAYGEIRPLPGRNIAASDVKDADILLVRSVTKVDSKLLGDSSVKFVGSCTIGTDHLDKPYLDSRGITYANAPGCNADSVVDYVYAALTELRPDWLKAQVGVIGCGNVGGRLLKRLAALGVQCCGYDPLLSDASLPLAPLEQVLSCDVICSHAPLTTSGPFPSYHLLGESELRMMKSGATLISAGRGPVIDNQALKQLLKNRSDLKVALDVWEPEPEVDLELVELVDLATPHIAGYSLDGKVAGSSMICSALGAWLGGESVFKSNDGLSLIPSTVLNTKDTQALANHFIRQVYDIKSDDLRFRQAVLADDRKNTVGECFDALRKNYPVRRQLTSLLIKQESASFEILRAMTLPLSP